MFVSMWDLRVYDNTDRGLDCELSIQNKQSQCKSLCLCVETQEIMYIQENVKFPMQSEIC